MTQGPQPTGRSLIVTIGLNPPFLHVSLAGPSIYVQMCVRIYQISPALATDLMIHDMVVASDCKQVVKDLADGTGGCYANIVKEINLFRSTFSYISFIHEGRDSNSDNHNLG
jgi:hypothetical protein